MKRLFTLTISIITIVCLIFTCASAQSDTKYDYIQNSPAMSKTTKDLAGELHDLGYLKSAAKSATDSEILSALKVFQAEKHFEQTSDLDHLYPRAIIQVYQASDGGKATVWVPVYGGKKYHKTSACGDMDEPECVSLSTAKELGFTPCKRCNPKK